MTTGTPRCRSVRTTTGAGHSPVALDARSAPSSPPVGLEASGFVRDSDPPPTAREPALLDRCRNVSAFARLAHARPKPVRWFWPGRKSRSARSPSLTASLGSERVQYRWTSPRTFRSARRPDPRAGRRPADVRGRADRQDEAAPGCGRHRTRRAIVHLTHVGDEPSDPRPRRRHRRGHRGDRRQASRARPVHGLWPSRPTAARNQPAVSEAVDMPSSELGNSGVAFSAPKARSAGGGNSNPTIRARKANDSPTRPSPWAAPRSLLESTSDGNGPADAKVVPGEKPYRGWPPSLSIRVRSTVSSVLPRHLTLGRSTSHNSNPGRRR